MNALALDEPDGSHACWPGAERAQMRRLFPQLRSRALISKVRAVTSATADRRLTTCHARFTPPGAVGGMRFIDLRTPRWE